ncbi:hypothetical protein RHMOL_Rhmol12G0035200 [Rhododendron molle]|uniref:Uncharacterized protein n=1 Tax=Rhododendron molle TaxID=49168 RepID=A0ACC0LET9_RHOML|nr:hypothetical protein RHMOL_Rhmol12G0035200 [Rhododendron molle]
MVVEVWKGKDALWRKIIIAKYKLEEDRWLPKMEINRKTSPIWKDYLYPTQGASIFLKIHEQHKFKGG